MRVESSWLIDDKMKGSQFRCVSVSSIMNTIAVNWNSKKVVPGILGARIKLAGQLSMTWSYGRRVSKLKNLEKSRVSRSTQRDAHKLP